MIATIEHAVWEEKLYAGTFEDELRDGDSILPGSVTLAPPAGLNVGTSGPHAPVDDSPRVGWWVERDSTPGRHRLKIRALTTLGERLEGEVIVVVLP